MEGPFVDRLSDAMTSVYSRQCRASGRGCGCREEYQVWSEEGKPQKRGRKGRGCSALRRRDYLSAWSKGAEQLSTVTEPEQ